MKFLIFRYSDSQYFSHVDEKTGDAVFTRNLQSAKMYNSEAEIPKMTNFKKPDDFQLGIAVIYDNDWDGF